MKFFVYTSILLLIKIALCEENYEFKIMGNSIKNDILELPNKSKFNIFEGKGAFTDNLFSYWRLFKQRSKANR